jgi:hypothetical protein
MAITFGTAGPSQETINFDSVFAISLANYNKTLVDNISKTNALLTKLQENGAIKSVDGGTHLLEPLMYALANADWYDSYDELGTTPTEGLTDSVFEWRQLAVPIAYSMKEMKMNKQRVYDLVQARIMQAELGIKEKMNQAIINGAGAGALTTAASSGVNGASGVEPLAKLIHYAPSTSLAIGNINQSTYTWWRNRYKASTTSTYAALLDEFQNVYNSCSLGSGGQPDLILTDQTTYELFQSAHWNKFRLLESDSRYNFENTKFKNAIVTYDEVMHDVYSSVLNTDTYGTAYFINTKFMKLKYEASTNFTMTEFQKPVNQDARVAHILWMGNFTISNRRKHGVLGKIARTLS